MNRRCSLPSPKHGARPGCQSEVPCLQWEWHLRDVLTDTQNVCLLG
jgi:hypothetical protein